MAAAMSSMKPGDRIDDAYTIETLAGTGGMSEVYKARDDRGVVVAVKVLHRGCDEARLAREAKVLASLRSPGVLRYLAHGATRDGRAYLVTEWLEGETLADRLRRGRLTIVEALDLGERVATALDEAHRAGVVHRDLKPANLFLQNNEITSVKVLDFGIARLAESTRALTLSGAILGTAGYIAPEQARCERTIGPAADVFALGCVLFKCITGELPFAGDDLLATLLRLAIEDAPRASDLRADVPRAVDDLLASMLVKTPSDRLRDGGAAAAAIEAVRREPAIEDEPSRDGRPSFTGAERRVLSLVLIRSPETAAPDEQTQPIASDETRRRAMSTVVDRFRGKLHMLADGSSLVTFQAQAEAGAEAATDVAVRAVRCALALRSLVGAAPIAIVTGRSVSTRSPIMGEIIDHAIALLSLPSPPRSSGGTKPGVDRRSASREEAPWIRADDATAGLAGAAFEVVDQGGARWIAGERDRANRERLLLGKPTTCVGRDRELATLEALFAECVAEPVARAVIVTAGPGLGKSRVCHELLRRLATRDAGVEVWDAYGDAAAEGSPFGLVAQAIGRAAGLAGGEPPEVRRAKLLAYVSLYITADRARWVASMLGEIAGAPVPDAEASAELRAARKSPLALGDPIRRAWEMLVAGVCASKPLVILVEDLHWGDLPTVSLIEAALRSLADAPLFVLATARPEVHAIFPRLWATCEAQEIRLSKLTRRAGEKLVREVLGERLGDAEITALVDHAEGNAFFLEELIRAAAEGKAGEVPPSVVAMVEAKLDALGPEERRILRAASVFGQTFWDDGVAAIIEGRDPGPMLDDLSRREIVSEGKPGRFPQHRERSFRHAILREAAYGTLTEGDRAFAHRIAGDWLAKAGEGDALVLARHFEEGDDRARAASFLLRAAEDALRGNDLDAAIDRAERALRAGPEELRSAALTTLLEAYAWQNEWSRTDRCAEELFRRAEPGSRAWCMAAMGKLWAGSVLERLDGMIEAMGAIGAVTCAPDAIEAWAQAESAVVATMTIAGAYDVAAEHTARLMKVAGPSAEGEAAVRGWIELTQGLFIRQSKADPYGSLLHMRAASEAFARAGSPQQRLWTDVHVAIDLWQLGAHDEAVERLMGPLREPSAGEKLRVVASVATYAFAGVRADQGRLEEAAHAIGRMILAERAQGNRYLEGLGRSLSARIARRRRLYAAAASEALTAIDRLSLIPFDRAAALAELSAVRLAEGNVEEAKRLSLDAYGEVLRVPGYGEAAVRLNHVEVLAAAGDVQGARAAAILAQTRLRERASVIEDSSLRQSFLDNVPEHSATMKISIDKG